MSKRYAAALTVLAGVCAAGIAAWLIMAAIPGGGYAQIKQDGEIIAEVALSEECEFIIECDSGYNVITVSGGAISVTDADCPDKVCVDTGAVSGGAVPIICLPHRLEIRVVSQSEEIDGQVR